MFFRLLLESFRRQRRRKALAGIAILLGTTAVTAMLALATTIGDRIHAELAAYGANIVVTPKAAGLDVNIGGQEIHPATGNAYLHEAELDKLHTIFWANNITGVSPEFVRPGKLLVRPSATAGPYDPKFIWRPHSVDTEGYETLPVTAVGYWFNHRFGSMVTGAPQLHPWWRIQGRWPVEHSITPTHGEGAEEIAVGAQLAKRLGLHIGDWINMGTEFEGDIVGIVSAGDSTDNHILYPLDGDGLLAPVGPDGTSGGAISRDISRVDISARTKPEDALARRNPDSLSPALRDRWYCSPYANSIAYQIREAMPDADAEQVRSVEQSEGTVLASISGLMWLISGAAFLAAAFAVSAAMATAILERRAEIGLMRSLGAPRGSIALLFYAETGLLALLAGAGGYTLGSLLAAGLGASIFHTPGGASLGHALLGGFNPVLLPVVLGLALLIAAAGSTPSIRTALRVDPAATLRSEA